MRHPILDAPDGPQAEPEIHARSVEALGLLDHDVYAHNSPPGVVITDDSYDPSATRLRTSDSQMHLVIPELIDELRNLGHVEIPGADPAWPFVVVTIEVNDTIRDGHISLPNGYGLDHAESDCDIVVTGVAPNELTSTDDRGSIAGTPWHKSVGRTKRVALTQPGDSI